MMTIVFMTMTTTMTMTMNSDSGGDEDDDGTYSGAVEDDYGHEQQWRCRRDWEHGHATNCALFVFLTLYQDCSKSQHDTAMRA